MNAEWKVQSAFMASFAALALGPTAYPEREFTPPGDNTIWYELYPMPAGRDPVTLGPEGTDAYTGVMQVDVNGPTGEGLRTLTEAASAITAYYKAGLRLVREDQQVNVRKSEISQPRRNGSMVTISVSIFWYAPIVRTGLDLADIVTDSTVIIDGGTP